MVRATNHDSKVVSRFYLESVEEISGMKYKLFLNDCSKLGIPKYLRSDYGIYRELCNCMYTYRF